MIGLKNTFDLLLARRNPDDQNCFEKSASPDRILVNAGSMLETKNISLYMYVVNIIS